MALVIKTPTDQVTISALYKLLVRERPINQGAQKEVVYCVTQDGDGNLRIPMALACQLWPLNLPDYTQLPRKLITCSIELGKDGRIEQIPTYSRMVQTLITTRSAFGSLSCGFGKTILAVKCFAEMGVKAAVLTDSKLIFPQWVKVLKESTSAVVVEVNKGKNKDKTPITQLPDGDIYVMMVGAARKIQPAVLAHIKFLIVDEATYFITPERIPAMLNFSPSYILGLCAEIKRNDGMHCFLPYLFGNNVIRRISDQPFTVYRVETPYKPVVQYQRWTGKPDWNMILQSLADNEDRNEDIIFLCRSLPDSKIIVGTKRKEQARYIHRRLLELGEQAALLIQNTNTIPQCRILVGVYAKMGKGVDVKNLCPDWEGEVFDVAIVALDSCNPEQFVGRVFRHENPIVYHLVDDYSTLRKHFEKDCLPWYLARKGVVINTIINRPR
jgi:hypothetical protein